MRVPLPLSLCLAVACTPGGISGGGGAAADAGGSDGAIDPEAEPVAAITAPSAALGGLRVVLDGTGTADADRFEWTQTGGPALELGTRDAARLSVDVPADAAAGTVYSFELSVANSQSGARDSAQASVAVLAASFETFLGSDKVGNNEGIAVTAEGLWIVSTDRLDLFDADGTPRRSHELSGIPAGLNRGADGSLVQARYSLNRVDAIDPATGAASPLFAADLANYPLPDRDGNVYVSTRLGGTVERYAAGGGVSTFLDAPMIENPNALAFGPEDDVLYVGGADGVYRVPILAGGTAGAPQLYLSTGSEVDGIVFDAAGNLYAGCPNDETLYLAPYVEGAATSASRAFASVGTGNSYFVNPVFGRDELGAATLYYTNLSGARVGRVEVGVPALTPPLAVP